MKFSMVELKPSSKIYISILHNRNNNNHVKTFNNSNFPKIDFVIVNSYPFIKYVKKKELDPIEMIDIGGQPF